LGIRQLKAVDLAFQPDTNVPWEERPLHEPPQALSATLKDFLRVAITGGGIPWASTFWLDLPG
jgi:hypothetical protein